MSDPVSNPNAARKVPETRAYQDDEQGAGLEDFSRIPTDDPDAALRFCKSLARLCGSEGRFSASEIQAVTASCQIEQRLPELSVIIPIFNEEENIPVLYARLTRVLEETKLDYEIIFVDDGSRDKSLELLNGLTTQDKRVVLVELARNFGHQVAITAGLDFARGGIVAVMDADLQDPPEVLPQYIHKCREGYEVVYAIRAQRKEGWFKRTCYAVFYRLLRRVANVEIPLDSGDFCVMDRRIVELMRGMPERSRFVRGIRSWVGLKQVGIPFERQARHGGETKYTFGRLMVLALDGLISFSYVPLRMISFLGLSVSLLSIILAVFYFVKKLLYGLSPPGFASIMVSVFFLAGIQLVTLGVIGEYVGRVFEEAKRRPLYVLRRASRAP